WHVQVGQAQGIRDGPFFAEIRQRDNDAINPISVLLEQLGAASGLFASFDCAILALLRGERYHVNARCPKHANYLFATGLRKMVRKESAIPYDDTHGHFLG